MHKALRGLDSREVERILKYYGFVFDRQRGSHQHFVGVIRGQERDVTVIARQKHFAPDTLKSMIRQSGLSEEEWLEAIR